jgi:type IV secretion system protein VirB1
MENPSPIILAVRSETYDDVTTPGVIVEVDAGMAEELGAFEESALTEREAWDSNQDLAEEREFRG